MPTNRPVRAESTVAEILSLYSDITELGEEMRDWEEHMCGTGLENTDKYGEVSEAADILEDAAPQLEEACEAIKAALGDRLDILESTVPYTELKMYKGYQTPRWIRLSNAVTSLHALISKLQPTAEPDLDPPLPPELEGLLDDLESVLTDLDAVEFPSMY